MSITKTIGGDRLGSGKRQKQTMHGFERSNHNLSNIFRTTMSAGTLVPFMKHLALPGSTFDIELDSAVLTKPTIGPLYGSFKAQFDVFLCPLRLYQGQIHNNKLKVGMNMQSVKLPTVEFRAHELPENLSDITNIDTMQVNPSCILAYLGYRGFGIVPNGHAGGDQFRTFNAVPWIAYWDIVKNYYANKQEDYATVIHSTPVNPWTGLTSITITGGTLQQAPTIQMRPLTNGTEFALVYTGTLDANQIFINTINRRLPLSQIATLIVDNGGGAATFRYNWDLYGDDGALNWSYPGFGEMPIGAPQIQRFELEEIDNMREYILSKAQTNTAVKINDSAGAPNTPLQPWSFILDYQITATQKSMLQSQEGLALKCYQSDLFNNWMNTEWIDGPGGISEVTAIDTSGGSITIDTIVLQRKVYDMLNRIGLSGGTYDDWQEVQYDHKRFAAPETPMYMGGLSKEVVFQEVVSNAESGAANGGTQPLGTLAGRGKFNSKHKGGKIIVKVDEPSYIIGIVSLTPRLDYSQGNDYDVNLLNWDEFHVPMMDQIGFQELPTEWMAWWDVYHDQTTDAWITRSAGKQPAWTHLMTNINKTYGNFAIQDNEMFMTLNRQYQHNVEDGHFNIDDLTTYIDPVKYNNIFAQTELDAQNFWMQISIDITARKKMSAKQIPNL